MLSTLSKRYEKWMFAWETALTTRDTNRIVRPLAWGFEHLGPFACPPSASGTSDADRMAAANRAIVRHSEEFFAYTTPTDFRLEDRFPQLFPTNVRPETLAEDAELKRQAAVGDLDPAPFLRFTSPIATEHSENDIVNARWYPAPPRKPRHP